MLRKIVVFMLVILVIGVAYVTLWRSNSENRKNASIPITFNSAGIPSIEVEIQGKPLLLEVDFGSKFDISLSQLVLSELKTKPAGVLIGRDMKGDYYESPAYLIPKMTVGNRVFFDVIADEATDDYVKNTTIYTERTMEEILTNKKGVIGRGLLQRMSVLLDFFNSIFLESSSISELIDQGMFPKNFISIPFSIGRTGIILCVETDNGLLKLSLDTGCTVSFVRTSSMKDLKVSENKYGLCAVNSEKFVIAGKDFGRMSLYLYDITPELTEIDGILGMDFMEKRVFYIDYPNNVLYIGT